MAISKKIRTLVYNKYHGHCAYCGKEIAYKDMQIDHVIPLWRGWEDSWSKYAKGTDDLPNLMPACRACNFRKGVYSIEQFREELVRQRDGIVKRSFQVRQSIDYGLLEVVSKPIKFYFERCNDVTM